MLREYIRAIEGADWVRETGRVTEFFGLVVESSGPEVFVGERCEIYSRGQRAPVQAEVVGIKNGRVLMMPYGELSGIRLGSEVIPTGKAAQVPVGDSLLGRVIDAFGRPLDGGPALNLVDEYPLEAKPLNPLTRPRISDVLETGVRAIDTCLTIGRGQRIGIFSGSGVGKSSLLGMIARHMDADINVIGLIGERGREVLEFVQQILGEQGLARSVVVVATSDQPALVRAHAALVASTLAEYFRDQGQHVLLTMDSVTRFAMAQREIGLAVGEPPTSRGYTPSVFAALPRLLERGGTHHGGGSITALYTVLVEGDDLNDPISDSVRSILDGHIVLSRDLANSAHYPAIDVLQSKSRLMNHLSSPHERGLAEEVVRLLNTYQESKDLVQIGAYRNGSNPLLDRAVRLVSPLNDFLKQDFDEHATRRSAFETLQTLLKTGVSSKHD